MIEDPRGHVDYDETGAGPAVVLVPGSCSTGAAWRPVIAALGGRFRCVTTSLLGYGATAERRTASDPAVSHEIDALEAVIRKAGTRVHLVGHSWGGLVALALALRDPASLASLTVIEAPAVQLLQADGRDFPGHHDAFRAMTERYFADFRAGKADAIAAMIDFYGGAGTFASWPARVRGYAMETTAVNILDWASAAGVSFAPEALASLQIPVLVVRGGASPAAMQRANELLYGRIRGATLSTIDGAAHFMISTHADELAGLVARHVEAAKSGA